MRDEDVERGMAFFRETHPEAAEAMSTALAGVARDLMRYAAAFPFGALYQRDQLPKRERQIATLSMLAALGALPQLKVHIGIALSIGMTREEIVEIFLQLSAYAGFPAAINAALAAKEVFDAADAA